MVKRPDSRVNCKRDREEMACMDRLVLISICEHSQDPKLPQTLGSGLLASESTSKGSVWDTIRIPTIQAPLPPGSQDHCVDLFQLSF